LPRSPKGSAAGLHERQSRDVCTQWRVERTANRDDFQVLDDVIEYSKLQRVPLPAVFEEYTITHALQKGAARR